MYRWVQLKLRVVLRILVAHVDCVDRFFTTRINFDLTFIVSGDVCETVPKLCTNNSYLPFQSYELQLK